MNETCVKLLKFKRIFKMRNMTVLLLLPVRPSCDFSLLKSRQTCTKNIDNPDFKKTIWAAFSPNQCPPNSNIFLQTGLTCKQCKIIIFLQLLSIINMMHTNLNIKYYENVMCYMFQLMCVILPVFLNLIINKVMICTLTGTEAFQSRFDSSTSSVISAVIFHYRNSEKQVVR